MWLFKRAREKFNRFWKEKNRLPLTKVKLKSHQDAKVCYVDRRILQKLAQNKNYRKVRDHCNCTDKYGGAAHSTCILELNIPNEVSVVFHNGSHYDCESLLTISYKIWCIDSETFMETSLSNLVDNLKCKNSDCFLEYESVKDILIKYKCLSCN